MSAKLSTLYFVHTTLQLLNQLISFAKLFSLNGKYNTVGGRWQREAAMLYTSDLNQAYCV